MSNTPKDGGPAFPVASCTDSNGQICRGTDGMTLRDWFAGQENLSDCAGTSVEYWEAIVGEKSPRWQDDRLGSALFESRARAKLKLMRADALIAELAKGAAQ